MEISNTLRIGAGFKTGLALLFLVGGTASCSSARPPETGTDLPAAAVPILKTESTEIYGPFPSNEAVPHADSIVLVLGTGLTHGYAYIGAIRALSELKVSIHAIYATEVGALAASLYFTQPNPNRIDWALLRFNEKNLGASRGKFSLRMSSPATELEGKLREVFGERRIEALGDKLHIGIEDAKTGEALEAKSGDLWRALRGALAGANGFPETDFEGRTIRTSTRKISEIYEIARQTEKNPVVVIMTGEPPDEPFRKLVENQKSTLVYVPLPTIDNLDLKKRNQAVFSGKNAVHNAAAEILGLVGRKLE